MKPVILLFSSLILLITTSLELYSQGSQKIKYTLNLNEVITLASDSSLDVFIAQNSYLVEYWVYKNYKAGKLPFIDLYTTPATYNKSYIQEYNFSDSSYYYVDQQKLNSYLNLSLNQNIFKTGGRVFIDSDIARLENLKNNSPLMIYPQQLQGIAFLPFRIVRDGFYRPI